MPGTAAGPGAIAPRLTRGRARWLRAHVGSGGTSLVVGLGTVVALSGHVPAMAAQVDRRGAVRGRQLLAGRPLDLRARRRRRRARRPGGVCSGCPPSASASGPSPQALQSWDRYVAALERARAADLARDVPSVGHRRRSARHARARRTAAVVNSTSRAVNCVTSPSTMPRSNTGRAASCCRGVSIEQVADRLAAPGTLSAAARRADARGQPAGARPGTICSCGSRARC